MIRRAIALQLHQGHAWDKCSSPITTAHYLLASRVALDTKLQLQLPSSLRFSSRDHGIFINKQTEREREGEAKKHLEKSKGDSALSGYVLWSYTVLITMASFAFAPAYLNQDFSYIYPFLQHRISLGWAFADPARRLPRGISQPLCFRTGDEMKQFAK